MHIILRKLVMYTNVLYIMHHKRIIISSILWQMCGDYVRCLSNLLMAFVSIPPFVPTGCDSYCLFYVLVCIKKLLHDVVPGRPLLLQFILGYQMLVLLLRLMYLCPKNFRIWPYTSWRKNFYAKVRQKVRLSTSMTVA